MRLLIFAAGFVLLSSAGCGDDAPTDTGPADTGPADSMVMDSGVPDTSVPPVPVVPDGYCPGGSGCEAGADGTLMVGAATADVTPDLTGVDVMTVDMDGDGIYERGDGDEFMDVDGNGEFDGIWIAGYDNARPASGVNDPQWARAIALQN